MRERTDRREDCTEIRADGDVVRRFDELNALTARYEQSRTLSFGNHGRKYGGIPEKPGERAPHVPVKVRRAAE